MTSHPLFLRTESVVTPTQGLVEKDVSTPNFQQDVAKIAIPTRWLGAIRFLKVSLIGSYWGRTLQEATRGAPGISNI